MSSEKKTVAESLTAAPATEQELEDLLSQPYSDTVELMQRLQGDIMILGVAGKMGPSLARLARRACDAAGITKRVIGVSRFSDLAQRRFLEQSRIETIVCDLADMAAVSKLPKCENIIYMAGRKFGEVGSEAQTWIMNVVVPANVAQSFRASRIVCFSTGCVYELLSPTSIGSTEADAPAPVGEYANSCLGRERVFEHYSRENGTPVLLYRLNYAIDLRYGVLADIAQRVWNGEPVDRSVEAVNFIWQGDANNRALLCLEHATSPPAALNVTGSEKVQTEWIARRFGELLDKPVISTGGAAAKAYLSDAARSVQMFGPPLVSTEQMIRWTADWIQRGGRSLNKPTHFSVTDGQFLDTPGAAGVA
ncbi:MAG: NAD-dependent epimerase/dehydratase family protein [Candidatus Sumerlaeaceae bacterium]